MVNLHFDCNHFTILESKFNFAFVDGDFFNQEADHFLNLMRPPGRFGRRFKYSSGWRD